MVVVRRRKTSLETSRNAFALRFSVNQGFHCGRPKMSSLVFYSAMAKVVPVHSHPPILKETSEVYTTRTGSVRMLLQRPSCRKLRITAGRFSRVYAQLVELDPFGDTNEYPAKVGPETHLIWGQKIMSPNSPRLMVMVV